MAAWVSSPEQLKVILDPTYSRLGLSIRRTEYKGERVIVTSALLACQQWRRVCSPRYPSL